MTWRCANCGRFVAESALFHAMLIPTGQIFDAWYHGYAADPTIPCGPVRPGGGS